MAKLYEYLSEKYRPEEAGEIERRLLELSSLFEISQLLNASLDLSQILNTILFIPMGRLMISRGFVFLKQDHQFRIVAAKGIDIPDPPPSFSIDPISENILFTDQLPENATFRSNSEFLSFLKEHHLNVIIPLKSATEFLGGVVFGEKLTKIPLSEEETKFLISLTSIASTSIENALQIEKIKQINLELDNKIQQLRTLFDITQGLTTTFDEDQILKLFSFAVMGQMLINRFALFLNDGENYQLKQSKNVSQRLAEIFQKYRTQLENVQQPQRVEKLQDTELSQFLKAEGISLILPLIHQQKYIGMAFMGPKLQNPYFSDADIEFLTTLTGQTVISIENARLFKETLEKQKLEDELKVARQIQARLLPNQLPKIENYEVCGTNISSKEVGGDYYDVIPLPDNRVAIAIGDVSGKSVPAALLMANLQAALRTLIRDKLSLAEIVARLNDLIFDNTDADKFITFFVGILETDTHTFRYVNAGHNPPIFLSRNGEISLLDAGGIILGVLPEQKYEMGEIHFQPDDLLIAYTDGVNEALNTRDEEFGEERLIQLAKATVKLPVHLICKKIIGAIETFSKGMPQTDDITLVSLRRLK